MKQQQCSFYCIFYHNTPFFYKISHRFYNMWKVNKWLFNFPFRIVESKRNIPLRIHWFLLVHSRPTKMVYTTTTTSTKINKQWNNGSFQSFDQLYFSYDYGWGSQYTHHIHQINFLYVFSLNHTVFWVPHICLVNKVN